MFVDTSAGCRNVRASRAWLDPSTGKVYLNKEMAPSESLKEVLLLPGPWEGLVEIKIPKGESLIVPVHELVY